MIATFGRPYMQKLAIPVAAVATLATSVFAADMPVKALAPPTVWSWSGF
jgi:hypothetical protein